MLVRGLFTRICACLIVMFCVVVYGLLFMLFCVCVRVGCMCLCVLCVIDCAMLSSLWLNG